MLQYYLLIINRLPSCYNFRINFQFYIYHTINKFPSVHFSLIISLLLYLIHVYKNCWALATWEEIFILRAYIIKILCHMCGIIPFITLVSSSITLPLLSCQSSLWSHPGEWTPNLDGSFRRFLFNFFQVSLELYPL